MRVLLIGGTGTLSTSICNSCLKKGYDVTIVNRGNNNNNVSDKVEIIIGDIRNVDKINELLKDRYFDVVIDFISFTLEQLKTTLQIFNNRCEQFIFISSATAYTKTSERITEDFKLENNAWDYASNKIECENFLKENFEHTKQKYTIIRPYVTYDEKRIPFAIIPYKQWTLANRIIIGKPILLWDGGKAKCTLTTVSEFANGVVGLFLNEKAYNEAFHITSDNYLTWSEALNDMGKALNKSVTIAAIPSKYIAEQKPELKGVLFGDKGLDRIFDNTKIKSAVKDFKADTLFKNGIKKTFEYYDENSELKQIDYAWDAEIDSLIEKYYQKYGYPKGFDRKILTSKPYKNITFKNRVQYFIHRHDFIRKIHSFIRR